MKSGEELRRDFPETDAGFQSAVNDALNDLIDVRTRHAFRVTRPAIMLAVALLLTTAAVATGIHRMGIQGFIDRSRSANLSDSARTLLLQGNDFEDVAIDNPYADMVITEAVYDGMAVYILVEVTPKTDGMFYIPYGLSDSPYVSAMTYGRGYPSGIGIQDYAVQLGYKDVMGASFYSSMMASFYYDSCLNEDGTFSLMWWSRVRPEYQNLPELPVEASVSFEKNGYRIKLTEFDFVIPSTGALQRAVSREGESFTFEHAGVHVSGVEVVQTTMSTYVTVNYDIADMDGYRSSFAPKALGFLDENGEELLPGAFPLSERIDQALLGMTDSPYYITNLVYDRMPCQITLVEYEGSMEMGWTEGERYTFHLQ